MCTVTIPLLYTEKPDKDALGDGISKDIPDEVGTLTVTIHIKNYDNRIAVSIFNGDLALDLKSYPESSFDDYETQCIKILNYIKKE